MNGCETFCFQESINTLVWIRYVPAPNYTPEAGKSIVERLQARLGPVQVILGEVSEVPRGPNGKFRAVVCNLPQADRVRLEAAR